MRSVSRHLAVLVALAALIGCVAASARADGDPASDFLLSQSTFLSPFDGHIPTADRTAIVQMLAQAKLKGFPLKVAVITTRYDLGAVPILFDKPQTYAKFLGTEDYYYWKDELLVVMPNGYGIYKAAKLPANDKALIAALPSPATTDGATLVIDAEKVVRELAARHGITLTAQPIASSGSSANTERAEIAGGVLALALIGFAVRFGLRRRRGGQPAR
jgi:hypothetical protein